MRGSFHSMGTGYAWKRDDAAEQQRAQQEQEKAAAFSARVIGRRVVVTAAMDFGEQGTIVGVVDGLLQVQLDRFRNVVLLERHELQPVAA